ATWTKLRRCGTSRSKHSNGSRREEQMIIHKTITVARPPDVAFKLFTDEIGSWWPSQTHSFVGGDARCVLEPAVGGRLYERNSEGKEYTIGEVVAYEPGRRVSFTWNHGEGK